MRQLRATTFIAAVASLAAGGVHLSAGGPHLQQSVPLGVAFILTGWLQVLLGAGVWARPTRATAMVLTAVHIASIGALAVSRSVGLPFGHPGGAPFGVGGLTAVALEVVAIVMLALFLLDPGRVRRLPRSVALATLAVVLGGASVAVADVATGHAGSSGEVSDGHHGSEQEEVEGAGPSGDGHPDLEASTSPRDGPADNDAPDVGDNATDTGATDRRSPPEPDPNPEGGDDQHDDGHDHDQ